MMQKRRKELCMKQEASRAMISTLTSNGYI